MHRRSPRVDPRPANDVGPEIEAAYNRAPFKLRLAAGGTNSIVPCIRQYMTGATIVALQVAILMSSVVLLRFARVGPRGVPECAGRHRRKTCEKLTPEHLSLPALCAAPATRVCDGVSILCHGPA
jgi:hypothetical protein